MERRYKVGQWEPKGTVTRSRMLLRVARFVVFHQLRLRQRGGKYPDRWLLSRDGLRRIAKRTSFEDVGFKLFIQRKNDFQVLSIHKTWSEPPAPDLGCHTDIERAYGALQRRFGTNGISNGGIYFCRYVDGTRIVSRHGYVGSGWKGAAGDVFSSPDNMDALYDRARFLVAEVRQGRLNLDRIICGDDVWETYDGMVEPHYYRGAYHRHVHFEVHEGRGCL